MYIHIVRPVVPVQSSCPSRRRRCPLSVRPSRRRRPSVRPFVSASSSPSSSSVRPSVHPVVRPVNGARHESDGEKYMLL